MQEKPPLMKTPTSMAYKIQELEIKIMDLEAKLKGKKNGKKGKKIKV